MSSRYRADLPAWILIGGVSCLGLLAAYLDLSQSGQLTPYSILFVGASVFGFVWLLSFKIVLTPDEVVFRSLFSGRRALRNEEIKKVLLTHDWRRRKEGPWQLIVEPSDHSARELRINAKVFPRAAIDAVLERGRQVAEADDGGLREGVYLPLFRQLKSGGLSTVRITFGAVTLLLGIVALVVASFNSFQTVIFYWYDKRRVVVEVTMFLAAFLSLLMGERLFGGHRWLRSMTKQLPVFMASLGFFGVMIYVWHSYLRHQPHSVTRAETIWFGISLIGFVLCSQSFRTPRKRKSGR
jgi:hypothetical protein